MIYSADLPFKYNEEWYKDHYSQHQRAVRQKSSRAVNVNTRRESGDGALIQEHMFQAKWYSRHASSFSPTPSSSDNRMTVWNTNKDKD